MKFLATVNLVLVLWVCTTNILRVNSSKAEMPSGAQMTPDIAIPKSVVEAGGWPGGNNCCPNIPQELQKPGSCPLIHPDIACEKCQASCYSDYGCPGTQKCCCLTPTCGNGCQEVIHLNQPESGSKVVSVSKYQLDHPTT